MIHRKLRVTLTCGHFVMCYGSIAGYQSPLWQVYLGPAHVAGTWCFIHMFTGWMKASVLSTWHVVLQLYLKHCFDYEAYTPDGASSAYKHATASAMVSQQ
eukprot:3892578-Amphidinium_carterae.1